MRDGNKNVTMVLWMDKKWHFQQLYTGLFESSGESAVAFEPQTGSTDGFNNGDHLTVLYPGEEWVGEIGFQVL